MKTTTIRNPVYFLVARCIVFLALLSIESKAKTYDGYDLAEPLSLGRGTITPLGEDATFIPEEDVCEFVATEFGWSRSSCKTIDRIIFQPDPDISNIVIYRPNSDGYISSSEWTRSSLERDIFEIESSSRRSLTLQAAKSGIDIEYVGFLVPPKLDDRRNILYYAEISRWNGERTVNISLAIFDRRGFVPMIVTPADSGADEAAVRRIVAMVSSMYKPAVSSAYSQHADGDRTASFSGVAALFASPGESYGNINPAGLAAAAALIVIAALVRAVWVLNFELFIRIGNLFRRQN